MSSRFTRVPKSESLLVGGTLFLATALRVCCPTLTEFKFSEARLIALALELTDRGRLPLIGVPSSAGFDHSPLSIYLYLPPLLLTSNPIPATIYGGLIGVAAVALCWWLARRWPGGGPRSALLASLLFAVSPWAVVFSRKIWQVTFVPLLTLAFVGLMISALVTRPETSNDPARRWHLAWGIGTYAVLVQVHPSAVSLAPALVLWLLIFWRQLKVVPLLTGFLLAALTAIPFLAHQIQHGFPVLAGLRSLSGTQWDLSSLQLAWEIISGRSLHSLAGEAYPLLQTIPVLGRVFNLIGWLTLLGSLALLWRILSKFRCTEAPLRGAAQVDMILLSWLAIPVILNIRHSLDLHLHFYALILPAAFLIIGRSAEFALDRAYAVRPRLARVFGLAGICVLGVLTITQVLALVLMARFVATQDTAGGFGTPLARYLEISDEITEVSSQLNIAEILIVGRGDSIVVDETPAIFDILLRNKIAYRFVNGQDTAVFPPSSALVLLTPDPGEAADWYARWPSQDLEAGFRLLVLDGSWPQDSLQKVEGARTFENGIEFQSYLWDSAPPAREGKSDSNTTRFWLLWQVLWLSPDDTHFYVQILDRNWSVWGQQDSVGYPHETRQKGDRILSKFSIAQQQSDVEAPTWARAGLYLYPEVTNLALIDHTGEPAGDAIVVGPLQAGP